MHIFLLQVCINGVTNMTREEMQSKIDSYHFWDARVLYLNCNHFADEIELAFSEENTKVIYKFVGCYRSVFDHVISYDKLRPTKEMTIAQIPYFIQEIGVDVVVKDCINFYVCKINMFPLSLEVWCKDIEVISSVT